MCSLTYQSSDGDHIVSDVEEGAGSAIPTQQAPGVLLGNGDPTLLGQPGREEEGRVSSVRPMRSQWSPSFDPGRSTARCTSSSAAFGVPGVAQTVGHEIQRKD